MCERGTAGTFISVETYEMGHWGVSWGPLSSRVLDGEWKEVSDGTWVLSSATESWLGAIFILLGWFSLESSSSPGASKFLSGLAYQLP